MTTLRILLYRAEGLVEVRMRVPADVLSERELEPGECTVEADLLTPLLEESALDALEIIRPVAAVVARRPWSVVPIRLPAWAPDCRTKDVQHALWVTAGAWSDWQVERYHEDHPTGREDAKTYIEEAPYGSEL